MPFMESGAMRRADAHSAALVQQFFDAESENVQSGAYEYRHERHRAQSVGVSRH